MKASSKIKTTQKMEATSEMKTSSLRWTFSKTKIASKCEKTLKIVPNDWSELLCVFIDD